MTLGMIDARSEALRALRPPLWVEEIRDEDRFRSLRASWNALVTPLDPPLLRHEWFETFWDHFGLQGALVLLLVWEGERLVTVAPLMKLSEKRLGIPCRILRSISNDHSGRFDFVAGNREPEPIEAILRHLAGCPGWDFLELQDVPQESRTLTWLARGSGRWGFKTGDWRSIQSPYIRIDRDWETYWGTLSGHFKRNLRRRRRQLQELGPVRVEQLNGGEAGWQQALLEGFDIEALAWKGAAGTSINSSSSVARFYQGIAEVSARLKWLRLYFLVVSDRKIAFALSLVDSGRFFLLKIGYDPAFGRFSPGILLHEEILRSAFEERLEEFDFLGPCMPWKEDWTPLRRSHVFSYVFSRSLRGRMLYWLKFQLLSSLKRSVLLRRLERVWRGATEGSKARVDRKGPDGRRGEG